MQKISVAGVGYSCLPSSKLLQRVIMVEVGDAPLLPYFRPPRATTGWRGGALWIQSGRRVENELIT
jgi:hypothetical protein